MTGADDRVDAGDEPQTLFDHLLELRNRLLRILLGIAVVAVPFVAFSRDLFSWLSGPLLASLPEGSSMIATAVASPFLTPFKLALFAAVVVSMPWTFYQGWAFVAPGLYRQERRLLLPLVVSSTLLFYLGILFAYFVVFPLIFSFFIGVAPEGVAVMTDINEYLGFVLKLFFAFGLAFEIPIAIILLVWGGALTPSQLTEKRPHVLVGAFVIGMLLTPPDIISQTLLALPAYLLFEFGILASRLLVPGYREVEQQRRDLAASADHPQEPE